MNDAAKLVDRALRLGEQIAGAVQAGAWPQLPALVEQRARVARQLAALAAEEEEEEALRDGEHAEPLQALAEQHERLHALLREQRVHVESELAEIDQLKNAHDSYEGRTPPPALLDARLAG